MGKGVGIGSVAAGRAFVPAYVLYVHFVERLCANAGKRSVREESDYFRALFGPALLDRIR